MVIASTTSWPDVVVVIAVAIAYILVSRHSR